MGTIKQGILGGFSGKVGTVVGGSWKGITYMRSMPESVANPRTEKQQKQRSKFSLVQSFLRPIMPVIRIGYRGMADRQTAYNAATSHILKNAITGTYPNFTISYPNVLIAKGGLPNVSGTAAKNGGNIVFTWTNNSGEGAALATDVAYAVVYNASRNEAACSNEAVSSAGTVSVAVQAGWVTGNKLEAYLFLTSADESEVSTSVFLGEITL
ncbi:MAG: hypothetical protein J6S82_10140 [Bacteroidales bacterium]|nr:hypothetical protein [Bacteroidales bacterium]